MENFGENSLLVVTCWNDKVNRVFVNGKLTGNKKFDLEKDAIFIKRVASTG